MGVTGWLRWSNPPNGAIETLVDLIQKEYSGNSVTRTSTQVTSYRSSFPVPAHKLPPPPHAPTGPAIPHYDRSLYTIQSNQSSYLICLAEDRLAAPGKEAQLCFSVTPPSSLGSILVATKSGFTLPPRASGSGAQVIDLGTNSAKAVRAQINTIKIESMTYEIPLVRLGLGGGSGLSSGGRKVEIEWIVRVGSLGVAGKGGIVIEAEYLSPPSAAPLTTSPFDHVQAFLRSLLPHSASSSSVSPRPSPQLWKSIGVDEEDAEGWEDLVEKGRRSGYILIGLLKTEGLV
ncbi:hypothetical protein BDY24DRAFT_412610 [Mrakia frigida]|uniref:uncharacterized protein n=1 Tax=Mrakia frigida TaxID=29902 RepID=UPI003FCBFE0D